MEKTIYELLKDWHELYKSGVISEKEFINKKTELLSNNKVNIINLEEHDVGIENFVSNQYNYEENLYEEESFFSKYKLFIILIIICSLIFGLNYYINKPMKSKKKQQTTGTYIINSDGNYLVYFHTEPKIETQRKSYFSTRDTVYVSKIDNGFGYIEHINKHNQKSKGWIKLEDMIFLNK